MSRIFPDITQSETPQFDRTLDKVGMSGIEVPVHLELPGMGHQMTTGYADAYVSLDKKEAKGIHMSRLFLSLQKRVEKDVLTMKMLKDCLDDFLNSHDGLSHAAFLKIGFEMPVKQKSLLSGQEGWRSYDVTIDGQKRNDSYHFEVSFVIKYSSTCPCSAALARQVIQKNFQDQFEGKDSVSVAEMTEWLGQSTSINATPHGQRSLGYITLVPDPKIDNIAISDYITLCEQALKTPVQAAVKREDEQEFARLNGENLMFAEDAARKMAAALESRSEILDFKAEARHLESLHAHDAVAIATKGIKNGLSPKQSW